MKVSVRITTYNQERFIAQAIESALMQEASFDWEIVIGEDFSTDGTGEIVTGYRNRYPHRIRLLKHERNLGMHENSRISLEACRGEYVAFLEGDDYWTAPSKLQRQADFLDRRPDCALCFHDALVIHEEGGRAPKNCCPRGLGETLTLEELLRFGRNIIPTCSVMYRRKLVEELPRPLCRMTMLDWPRHVVAARHGKVGYLDEVLGVYRIHQGGMWSRGGAWTEDDLIRIWEARRVFFETINPYLAYAYDAVIKENVARACGALAVLYKRRGDWITALIYLSKGFFARSSFRMLPRGVIRKLRAFKPGRRCRV